MKKIPLTQGQVALVDDEDYDYLMQWKWCAYSDKTSVGKFYAVRGQWDPVIKKQIKIKMHREIMQAKKGEQIDHKDNTGLNNQKHNIRFCTGTQNQANSPLQKNSTSGYKGVNFNKDSQKWRARINYNYKRIYLGHHTTPEEAARAYDKKAIELFGEFARTNFPRRVARKR